jgi:hypothetical protein
MSPEQALKAFATQPGKQQFHQNPQFTQPTHNTLLASPMNDMSPLLSHTNIAGGGIVSSPQPGHYPSPMSSQTSQTGATGPTTPLMSNRQAPSSAPQKVVHSNKRRRGSAVASIPMKEEDEDALNPPAKLPKQSPRIGIGGRGAGGPGGPSGKRIRNDA